MPLRAVVFDFDGVIANSEPLHFRALHDILLPAGVTLSERDYYTRYLGFDDVAALRAIGADSGAFGPDRVDALVSRKAVRFEELEAEGATLFPGAVEAVRRIAASVPVAIASGARREEILRALDAAGLLDLFVAIVAAEDVAHSKPDPAPYLLAVSLLADAVGGDRLQPSECVAIEDSHWGLESARVAGLHTVALSHTYKPSELGAADLVVESLDALDIPAIARAIRT